MSIEPHIAPEPTPIEPEIEELDLFFNAYFEGDLTREEREDFERRLESDEPFRSQYNEFVNIMGGLRALPFEFAPDDFVERVESRIRTRSAGRFFADNYFYRARVPYEVIAIVMIVVMAAAYMMMEVPKDRDLRTGDVTVDRRLK